MFKSLRVPEKLFAFVMRLLSFAFARYLNAFSHDCPNCAAGALPLTAG